MEDNKKNSNLKKFVLFKIGNEQFGMDIKYILEIIKIQNYTKVPQAPNYIEGIINLRGRVIGVVNLNEKLGFSFNGDDDKARIIVAEIGKFPVGLRVDSVKEVIELDTAELKPTPSIIVKKMDHNFIQGIFLQEDNMIIIIKIEEIVSVEEASNISSFANDVKEVHSAMDASAENPSDASVPAEENQKLKLKQ